MEIRLNNFKVGDIVRVQATDGTHPKEYFGEIGEIVEVNQWGDDQEYPYYVEFNNKKLDNDYLWKADQIDWV